MKYTIVAMIAILGTTTLFAANDAEKIFDNKCNMCHIKTRPQHHSNLVAPPIMGVLYHVKQAYSNKKDAVAFIVDYVREPSKSKALCMPQKIKHFGLMPSQKANISKEDLQKVASWLYDTYPPANFKHKGMRH
jgi:cytochrome c